MPASFFAAPADRSAVLAAVLALPGVRVAEADAPFDCVLRELAAAGDVPGFVVWTVATARGPGVVRVALDPGQCGGHTFRESAEGAGLVRVTFGTLAGRCLTRSDVSHPHPGTRGSGADPAALEALATAVIAALEALAVARVPGRAVLPVAHRLALAGGSLTGSAGGRAHPVPVPLPGPAGAVAPVAVAQARPRGWAPDGYTGGESDPGGRP